MSIEKIFSGGNFQYVIANEDPRTTARVARDIIQRHIGRNPEDNLVWAFYSTFFGLTPMLDGIRQDKEAGRVSICRSYGNGVLSFSRRMVLPLEGYLEGTNEVYLQLCGREPLRAGGIERAGQGSRIGHYSFAQPLPVL